MAKYRIVLPKDALEHANLDAQTSLMLMVDDKKMVIRPLNTSNLLPQVMLRWCVIPALLAAIIFGIDLSWHNIHIIPLVGDISIATGTMVLGLLSGVLAFMFTFIYQKRHHCGPAEGFYWRNLPTLTIACGTMIFFSFLVGFWILEEIFNGASFDIYTASFFVFLIVAVATYVMINLAMTMSESVITNLMTVMIVGGMLFAMLTNSRRDWWRYNFSFLGTQSNPTNWRFNITLIFSALLMITLVDYLFVNLEKHYEGLGIKILRGLLYGEALCLGGVGCFPNDPQYHVLHDRISMGLIYILLILIIALRWLIPFISKQFLRISYTLGAVMAAGWLIFKLTHYLSLTAFELLEFGLAFSWLMLLFQNIEYLAKLGDRFFPVEILPVENKQNE